MLLRCVAGLLQALMAAVSIPRSAALNALKAAGGDAAAALAGQLMRFRLNFKKVDALAWEYAVARCAAAAVNLLAKAATDQLPSYSIAQRTVVL
jgi:hypothetical protein